MKHIDENTLWDYIIGDLHTEHTAHIKQHLEVCAKCKHEYEIQSALHHQLFEVGNDIPSSGFSGGVIHKMEHDMQVEKANRFWLKFAKSAIISAIIIAIALPLLMLTIQKIELSVHRDYVYKVILPLFSICVVLWALYGMDILLKRNHAK